MPRKYSGLRDGDRLWPKVVKSETCWAWVAKATRDGYGRLRDCEQRWVSAHVYAWWLATGHWPTGDEQVCHTCDVRHCVRNDDSGTYEVDGVSYERHGHLWLGTQTANQRDKALKGRAPRMNPAIRPRGDAHWTRREPERRARGDRNGSRLHPERLKRGDENPSRLHPESRPRGEAHALAKLTAAQVIEMRALAADGWSLKALARHFARGKTTVAKVVHRETWRHV